jgi:hypothetical protein
VWKVKHKILKLKKREANDTVSQREFV